MTKKSKECPYCKYEGMEFKFSDWDWSDWHQGLSPVRRKRYEEVIVGIALFLYHLLTNNEYKKYQIKAGIPEGIFSTGVQGDQRTYAPVVMLFGPKISSGISYDVIGEISTKITNAIPVNRVVYNLGGANPFRD